MNHLEIMSDSVISVASKLDEIYDICDDIVNDGDLSKVGTLAKDVKDLSTEVPQLKEALETALECLTEDEIDIDCVIHVCIELMKIINSEAVKNVFKKAWRSYKAFAEQLASAFPLGVPTATNPFILYKNVKAASDRRNTKRRTKRARYEARK